MTLDTRDNYCYICTKKNSKIVAQGRDFQYTTTSQVFDWHRCNECGHHFIDPLPEKAALDRIYPKTLKNYEEFDKNPGVAFRVKRFLDVLSLKRICDTKPDMRFLDVGCASGHMLDSVKAKFRNFTAVDGIEISNAAARGAVAKGHRVFIGTIEEVELRDNFYDVIYMQQVIEHVHDPRRVMQKLYKKLREGGKLVMETPALGTWDQKCFSTGTWEGYHIPRHFNLWVENGMNAELEACGFREVSIKYKIKPVHWTVSIQNWIRKTGHFTWLDKRFDMNVRLPIEIMFFGVVDCIQLLVTRRTSDVQYLAKK